MRITRTRDLSVINAVFKHPKYIDMLGDDGSENVEYPLLDSIYYLAVYDGVELAGLFMMVPQNAITIDTHGAFLPGFRGEKARTGGLLMPSWVAKNTQFKKLVACIPSFNKAALAYASKLGYELEGVNRASFVKDGVVYNQCYYGREV
ncbi:MAG: DUF2824 family protein [Gammaproteobacteria bacterium]|nr:MAG: DUF2824 family protein [Gammaproteobacteria bacterium]